jgi:hypothetical protein
MDRSTLLKIAHKLNKIFNFLNKYLYLLTFSSWIFNNITYLLPKAQNIKLFNVLYNIIKIILFISIIFSVGVIAYFTDFNTPFNNTFNMYNDLLEPYIEILKHSYNKLVNYFNNILDNIKDFVFKNNTNVSSMNIENEIKSGIKSGIKEALADVIDELETESNIKSDYLMKNLIIVSSVLFTAYLLLYLPSDATVDINQYNSLNQFFINIKLSVINIFSNPTTGGSTPPAAGDAGGSAAGANISPPLTASPPTAEASTYFRSPASDSSSILTVTPASHTPVIDNASNISPLLAEQVPSISKYIEQETQTQINGFVVGKMFETIDVLQDSLNQELLDKLQHNATTRVTKIWQ